MTWIPGKYDENGVTDEPLVQQLLNNRLDELDADELPPSLAILSTLALSTPFLERGRRARPLGREATAGPDAHARAVDPGSPPHDPARACAPNSTPCP